MSTQQGTRSNRRSRLTVGGVLLCIGAFAAWFSVPETLRADSVQFALDSLFVLSWLGMPIAIYADIRTVRRTDADWRPAAPFWILGALLPVLNAKVAVVYLCRRYERVTRRESWEFWWRGASAGASMVWLLLVIDILLFDFVALDSPTIDAVFTDLFGIVFFLSLFLVPMAIKYDIAYVTSTFDWTPEARVWIAGAAIPFVNLIVVISYAMKRSPDSPFSVIGETTATEQTRTNTTAAVDSPNDETTRSGATSMADTPSDDRSGAREWWAESDTRSESDPWGSQREYGDRDSQERDRSGDHQSTTAGNRRHESGSRWSDTPGRRHESERSPEPVTSADVDSNWWYLVVATAVLGSLALVLLVGTVIAIVAGSEVGGLLLILTALFVFPLAILAPLSLVAIHFDAKAIRETDAAWQPSGIGYLLAGVLITPILAAFVYSIQRYRYLH